VESRSQSRASRRVTRPGAPGTDPVPRAVPRNRETSQKAKEDTDEAWGDPLTEDGSGAVNDDRLRREKPPHW
jgi:hypothetical protein